jgi:UDP-N-acetylglucosamine enolpyruvyl transferase
MCAYLTLTQGASVVHETIYENRVQHVPELQRMAPI